MNDSAQTRTYAALALEGRPSLPQCRACGLAHMPPRALCPTCGSDDIGWVEVTGAQATLYSLTSFAAGDSTSTIAIADVAVAGEPRIYAGVLPGGREAQIGDTAVIVAGTGPDGATVPMLKLAEVGP